MVKKVRLLFSPKLRRLEGLYDAEGFKQVLDLHNAIVKAGIIGYLPEKEAREIAPGGNGWKYLTRGSYENVLFTDAFKKSHRMESFVYKTDLGVYLESNLFERDKKGSLLSLHCAFCKTYKNTGILSALMLR